MPQARARLLALLLAPALAWTWQSPASAIKTLRAPILGCCRLPSVALCISASQQLRSQSVPIHSSAAAPCSATLRTRRCAAPVLAEDEAAAAPPAKEPFTASLGLPFGFKLPLKYIVLVLLVLQNSLTAILARASRVPRAASGGQLYLGSVAVLLTEVMKFPVCLALIARDEGSIGKMASSVKEQVVVKWKDTLSMGVPALCYCLQNALFFVALSRLSATNYQLWSQSKTLFTALFFVSYLGRVLRKQQWLALGLLTAGVGLVQYQEALAKGAAVASAASAGSTGVLVGIAAVLASSLLSGFANVYFEKVVKTKTDVSIWMRNVQLGIFSLPQAAALVAADAALISKVGPFVGFDLLAWTVVTLKALGGLLVAAVVKYADNVLKTYATAIAILLTAVISCVLTKTYPSIIFVQGMSMVIASIFLYNLPYKEVVGIAKGFWPTQEEFERALEEGEGFHEDDEGSSS